MSNPYNNPYVLFLTCRIKGMAIIMEATEEGEDLTEEEGLMEEAEAITMILINLAIKVMVEGTIKGTESRGTKMQLIVVHAWVRLAVLVVCYHCACVDVCELIFAAFLL